MSTTNGAKPSRIPDYVRSIITRDRDDIEEVRWDDAAPRDGGWTVPVRAHIDGERCAGDMSIDAAPLDYFVGNWTPVPWVLYSRDGDEWTEEYLANGDLIAYATEADGQGMADFIACDHDEVRLSQDHPGDAIRVVVIDEPEAEYDCPVDVGDRVAVRGTLAYTNHVGGTGILKAEGHFAASVVVTRLWWDYECGWRFRGDLMGLDVGFSEHQLEEAK